jgi:methyl-accepting chemotaxis protein
MSIFNLRITGRLVLGIAIPLAIFVCLAGYDLLQTWQTRSDMATLNHMAQGVTKISRLIHHLQRERGASAVFVGSKGAQMRAELPAQRKLTDEQRAAATAFMSEAGAIAASGEFNDAIAKASAAVVQLGGRRSDIDGLNISAQDSNAYFTETVAKLLMVAGEIAKVSSRGDTSTAISAYVNFMQGKERAGQERATGAAGVSEGKFNLASYVRVLGLRAAQDTYFGAFADAATPAQRSFLRQTVSGSVVETLATMRDIIAAGGMSGQLQGVDGKSWYDATTARIDLLKTVEDRIADDLIALAATLHGDATRALIVLASIIAAAFAVSLAHAFLISRSIATPIRTITGVLVDLTNDRVVDVPYTKRDDEIGDIARATEIFKQSVAEKVINLRVRSGLDVVRSNVMIADQNYNIMYMNGTLTAMLREAESEVRKVLPQFDSSRLIGTCMDVFHKDPSHQRRMMDSLVGSHEAHIIVGTLKFHLVATAIMDQHGKRAGAVIEWRNETAEKAIEEEIHQVVNAAIAGDFSRRIPLEGKQGFMRNLATAMNGLGENTAKALNDLARMLGALSEGDFRRRIAGDYQGMFGQLKTDANAMADRISTTVSDIKAAVREVTNASAEISTSSTDLSQRTEEQAASLEQTSASMGEISETVKKNAENAQHANESAGSARAVANRGGDVVAKAVEAMGEIANSSRKISDIIGVIDEIARQTNLLALNAAVEAARAGEAGRGFAVVASEVRNLAQRSSQAAKDIKDLITSSGGQVQSGVDLVNKAGGALAEIVESINKVAAIVSDIASASSEQATGVEEVNKALTQMDEVTQQNSALVEEATATAKTLDQQAQAMSERVAFFRVEEGEEAQTGRSARAAPGHAAMRPPRPQASVRPPAGPAPKAQPARPRLAALNAPR